MKQGVDYIGMCVTFWCHDGKGNYLLHKRSQKTRDEQGAWDCGGGGLEVHETLIEGLGREIQEEYSVEMLEHEFLGFDEVFRMNGGEKTHWIGFRYRVLIDRDKVKNGDPEKIDELGWFKIAELPSPLHSQIPKELELYRDKLV